MCSANEGCAGTAAGIAAPTPGDWPDSDDFRMFVFKVAPCTNTAGHPWPACPFAHPGERAARRDPRSHSASMMCQEMLLRGTCSQGDACDAAHSSFEYWLHPSHYRTTMCRDGTRCARGVCFFAHTVNQLRMPGGVPRSAAAAAALAAAGGCISSACQAPAPPHQQPPALAPPMALPRAISGPPAPGGGPLRPALPVLFNSQSMPSAQLGAAAAELTATKPAGASLAGRSAAMGVPPPHPVRMPTIVPSSGGGAHNVQQALRARPHSPLSPSQQLLAQLSGSFAGVGSSGDGGGGGGSGGSSPPPALLADPPGLNLPMVALPPAPLIVPSQPPLQQQQQHYHHHHHHPRYHPPRRCSAAGGSDLVELLFTMEAEAASSRQSAVLAAAAADAAESQLHGALEALGLSRNSGGNSFTSTCGRSASGSDLITSGGSMLMPQQQQQQAPPQPPQIVLPVGIGSAPLPTVAGLSPSASTAAAASAAVTPSAAAAATAAAIPPWPHHGDAATPSSRGGGGAAAASSGLAQLQLLDLAALSAPLPLLRADGGACHIVTGPPPPGGASPTMTGPATAAMLSPHLELLPLYGGGSPRESF